MSNPTELLDLDPCPFCGGPARIESSAMWLDLICDHDKACILDGDSAEMSYQHAAGSLEAMVAKWNRRAQPEGEAQQAEPVAWMLDFGDERVVTADRKEMEAWTTQHDNPYTPIPLGPITAPAAQQAAAPVGYGMAYPTYSDPRTTQAYGLWGRKLDAATGAKPQQIHELLRVSDEKNGDWFYFNVTPSAPGTPEAPEDVQRDAERFRWIEENCRTEGGGRGFTVFVPVDHEDIGCGIDAAIQRGAQLDGGQGEGEKA